MSVLVLVVDDEPDVEPLFRQQFRRHLRAQRYEAGSRTAGYLIGLVRSGIAG
jgi:hypothetical protein